MFAFFSCFFFFCLLDYKGLMFLMHFRPNEVSKGLVSEIIESDSALKVSVGIADLLIFPSTILPEQNRCKCSVGIRFLPFLVSVQHMQNTLSVHLPDALFSCA